MPLPDLFHRREAAREKAGEPDVYQYDVLPEAFRIQVEHILPATIGSYRRTWHDSSTAHAWRVIYDVIVRDAAQPYLGHPSADPDNGFLAYFRNAPTRMALSCIELAFRVIDRVSVTPLSPPSPVVGHRVPTAPLMRSTSASRSTASATGTRLA